MTRSCVVNLYQAKQPNTGSTAYVSASGLWLCSARQNKGGQSVFNHQYGLAAVALNSHRQPPLCPLASHLPGLT